MSPLTEILSLLRLSLADPIEGGKRLIALNPPMPVRWMLLGAAVAASVVLLYLMPVMLGDLASLPGPFAFAATQLGMNIVVIVLITMVGQAFGGKGRFAEVLWLVGWMQVVTALLLVAQIAVMLVLPVLNIPVGVASVAVSIWVLVGYICAIHGFASRGMVLLGGLMTFVVFSIVLSMILLMLGLVPAEMTNV